MKILVINSGSSSLKFQVIDSDSEQVLARGVCERIGIDGVFTYKTGTGISRKEPVSINWRRKPPECCSGRKKKNLPGSWTC